jgi:hypothetical protein
MILDQMMVRESVPSPFAFYLPLIANTVVDISRTLHSPSSLEKIGLVTGAELALGPFGFSVGAVEYARKNGADSARIQAIDLLADDKTEGVRDEMKSALDDKDPGVRAAAVNAPFS